MWLIITIAPVVGVEPLIITIAPVVGVEPPKNW